LLSREHTVFGSFNGTHLVSINGDIINLQGERAGLLLKQETTNWGYKRVNIYSVESQTSKRLRVHRLVMLVHNPKGELIQVNHRDGNKTNNRIENLEWSTQSSNQKHAYKTGLNKASTAPKPTLRALTDDQVKRALKLRQLGRSYPKIGEVLGVSSATIRRICIKGYAV